MTDRQKQETVDNVLEEIRSLVNAPKFTREGILFYAERLLAAVQQSDEYKRGREEAWNELRGAAIAHGGVTNFETGEMISLDKVDLTHVGAELHAKWKAEDDFFEELQCIRDAFGHLSTGGDRTVHEALLKDTFILLDWFCKTGQGKP